MSYRQFSREEDRMNTQHTPGPWYPPEHVNGVVYATHRKAVAVCEPLDNYGGVMWPRSPDECEANARLIAAAPELVEVLRSCLEYLEANPDEFSEPRATAARAALAKAAK